MSIIIPANSAVGGGFEVANSLRFNRPSSDYLNRTQSGGSAPTKATFSTWLKRTNLGIETWMFDAPNSSNQSDGFRHLTGDTLQFLLNDSYVLTTNRLFRDVSAWYHLVVAMDTTQNTDSNRVKLYVNGVQETSFSATSYPSQNATAQGLFVSGRPLYIGRQSGGNYLDGYLAETVFIDGQGLAPTSFGEFDSDSGVWKPIDVSGLTFGTNGAYLDFEDSSALGNDAAGSNNFTVNNLTAIDQSTDTCTNNFCTLNPLTKRPTANGTIAEGNLQYTASTGDSSIFGTMAIPPGMKVYFEVKLVSNTAQNSIGIHSLYDGGDGAFVKGGSETGTYSFKPRGSGSVTQYFNNGSSTDTSIDNPANNTILGVAINNNNGQIHYHIAGTYINSSDPTDNDPVALVTGFGGASEQYLHFSLDTTTTQPSNQFNFGSPPYSESGGNSDGNGYGNFAHAVPSGYYALNTKNLAEYG